MSLSYRDTQIVKGMLDRGDKQHDIASYFGVNGGRIAEISTGKCDYPTAPAMPPSKLPPAGPYVGAKTVFEVKEILGEAIELIEGAGTASDEAKLAIEALHEAVKRL